MLVPTDNRLRYGFFCTKLETRTTVLPGLTADVDISVRKYRQLRLRYEVLRLLRCYASWCFQLQLSSLFGVTLLCFTLVWLDDIDQFEIA